jgi:hypothetical protein
MTEMQIRATSPKAAPMSHKNSLTRLVLDADDYNTAYTHPLVFRLLYFVAQTPQSELPWETFTEGGFEIEPTTDPEAADPLSRTAIKYRLLLDNSLDVEEVARILDTGVEGVRRRLADRTLYGIPTEDGLKIPSFQFANGELLPGLENVMPLLHDDLHPIAVQNWFTSPNTDLLIRDEQVSPRQWLLSGRNPDDLARIAIDV